MSDPTQAMSTFPTGTAPVPSGEQPRAPEAKKPRKKRAVTAAPAPRKKKRKAKKVARKVAAPKVAKPRRGRGDVTLDLGGAMDLLGSMHRTDVPVFQTLSEALTGRGKPSRRRLLAALNKVFG